jgi:hypothetical protein
MARLGPHRLWGYSFDAKLEYLSSSMVHANSGQSSKDLLVISYHNHFVPAISYHSENHFRTICRSTHYDHFVPYADRHIMTISYHMQIDTLWPFRTICRSIHYYNFVPYADRHIMTISYHMQINTLWPFRTICKILRR